MPPIGTSVYPTSLDTVSLLVEVADDAATQSSLILLAAGTTLTVTDTSEFPATGILTLGALDGDGNLVSPVEKIPYTSKTATEFLGLTRSFGGTTAPVSWPAGTGVQCTATRHEHEAVVGAIIGIESKLGIGPTIAVAKLTPLTASRVVVTDGSGFIAAATVSVATLAFVDPTSSIQTQLDSKSGVAHTHAFGALTGTPTTLAGYGIVDAAGIAHTHAFSSLTGIPTTLAGYGIVDAYPLAGNPSNFATVAYADSLVVGLLDDRGNYDASVNTFPAAGGSGAAGAVLKGDLWTVSVGGTLGGVAVTPGDLVRAIINSPGQTAANWAISETNIGYVPLNAALADGAIYIGSAGGIGTAQVLSGNVTVSNAGVTTIGALVVTNAMLAGSIALSKLSITGTPDGTKFLRDDATWQTVVAGGTPGGSTKQVQFNNSSAFGGAAGFEYQSAVSPNVLIQAQAAGYVPLVVKGFASQTVTLQQWQDSSANARMTFGHIAGQTSLSLYIDSYTAASTAINFINAFPLAGGFAVFSATYDYYGGDTGISGTRLFLGASDALITNRSGYLHINAGAASAGTPSVLYLQGSQIEMRGTGSPGVLIPAQAATYVPLAVKGFASQTANLTEWQNSSATVLTAVGPAGYLTLPGGLRFLGRTTVAGVPTTTELPTDKDCAVHKNSTSGVVSFAYNDGGTVKTVALA